MIHKKIKKKVFIVIITIITVLIIAQLVYLKLIKRRLDIKPSDVKLIKVTCEAGGDVYYSSLEFTVSDQKNVQYILDTIEASMNDRGRYKGLDKIEPGYNMSIELKDGNTKEYKLKGYDIPARNHMEEVLSSKEVVQQIRTAFTIDKSRINKVEYYYWENTEDMLTPGAKAIREEITDTFLIDKILEIAKKDALKEPQKSMENTRSGFGFKDSDNDDLLVVNLRIGMEGYEELVKMMPKIEDHVK